MRRRLSLYYLAALPQYTSAEQCGCHKRANKQWRAGHIKGPSAEIISPSQNLSEPYEALVHREKGHLRIHGEQLGHLTYNTTMLKSALTQHGVCPKEEIWLKDVAPR